MKVNVGKYRHRWVSYVHERYMDKKYGRGWEDNSTRFESFLEKVEDGLQWIYNHSINLYLDKRPGQKIKVRIDPWDTWSMDHTLAPIILPMLKQLKESKHGSPWTDDEDVPEELRSTSAPPKENEYDLDGNHHARWNWVMGEMIWAFEQKTYDWDEQYYGDWQESEDDPLGGRFLYLDSEGRKSHQKRMTNGFRLFGKYYENLWD